MPGIRHPARAGSFYAAERQALRRQVEACFLHSRGPGAVPTVSPGPLTRLAGIVSPHAGLMYSGPAAAWGFAELARAGRPDLVVLLGPNHSGLGAGAALSTAEAWQTPLGLAAVDQPATAGLLEHGFTTDDLAHQYEHSIEVQLLFLQFLYGEELPPIVPIVLRSTDESARRSAARLHSDRLAAGLATLLEDRATLLVASSDLSHYLPAAEARRLDDLAVNSVLTLEPGRVLEVVDEHAITMCGVLPVALTLQALAGVARTASLLTYYNSGDISGDHSQVVGYASIALETA